LLKDLKDLEVLKGLTQLAQLDLFGCPVETNKDYREKVFSLFKELSVSFFLLESKQLIVIIDFG